jgi:hypothetical protein
MRGLTIIVFISLLLGQIAAAPLSVTARTDPTGTQAIGDVTWIAGYCNATSLSSANVVYNYTWFNGATAVSSGSVGAIGITNAYRGQATSVTQDAGLTTPNNANDSNYATYAFNPTAGANLSVYYNYTIENLTSAVWEVKHDDTSPYNITIPIDGLSSPVRLMMWSSFTNNTVFVPESTSTWTNGTSSSGGADQPWRIPTLTTSLDGSYANCNMTTVTETNKSMFLNGTNFGFAIPGTATIKGIVVGVTRSVNSTSSFTVTDYNVSLMKHGALVGDNLATSTVYTTTLTNEDHGTSSELWGETWTPADINDAEFGVLFSVRRTNTSTTITRAVRVDYINITVYYSLENYSSGAMYFNQTSSAWSTIGNTSTFGTGVVNVSSSYIYDQALYYNTSIFATSIGTGRTFVNDSGFTNANLANDSDYATKATYTNFGSATLYWNYTNPATSRNQTTWQVKYGKDAVTTNITLPSACAAQATIQLKITSNNSNMTQIQVSKNTFTWASTGTGNAWATPARANNSDDAFATSAFSGTPYISANLSGTNWGFQIPEDATIAGVVVTGERKVSSTSSTPCSDYLVKLQKAGAVVGDNEAYSTAYTTGDVNVTYGGINNLSTTWNTALTPADVNDTNFGILFQAYRQSGTSTARTVSVDYINMTVYYNTTTLANYSQTSAYCYDGADWIAVGTNSTATNDFSASDIYEQDVYFNITNESGFANNTEFMINNKTSGITAGNWIFECNATDNVNGIVSANSSVLQITSAGGLACGQNLDAAGTTYNMTSDLAINGSTCFTINAENVTLDCAGYSITGNNSSTTYAGVFSYSNRTTIKNCNISGFTFGIYFWNVSNGNIGNSTITSSTTNGSGIYIVDNSDNNLIENDTVQSDLYIGIRSVNNKNNTYNRLTVTTATTREPIYISNGTGCLVSDSVLSAGNAPGVFIYTGSGCVLERINITTLIGNPINLQLTSGVTVSNAITTSSAAAAIAFFETSNCVVGNSTFTRSSSATSANMVFNVNGSNNIIYNNVITDVSKNGTLVKIVVGGNNTFYWNNFTETTGPYVNDTNGSNFYNLTVDGKNQGNIYFNMNSSNLSGTVASSIPGYNIATSGSSYPYNNSTSGGKFVCNFNGCGDYAPLFYYQGEVGASCVYSGSGDWIINGADNCVIGQSANVSGVIKFNGNGNITFYNITSNKIKFNTTAALPIWLPGTNLFVQYITKTIWLH